MREYLEKVIFAVFSNPATFIHQFVVVDEYNGITPAIFFSLHIFRTKKNTEE